MTVRFTRFRSIEPPVLTKTFEFKVKDRKRGVAKRAGGQMRRGKFDVVETAGLEDFAELLTNATPDVAFAYGVPRSGEISGEVTMREKATSHQLTRTEADMSYASSEAGIMFADYDPQPEDSISEKHLVEILREAIGVNFEMLTSHSSSSWLYLPNGKPWRERRGLRAYWIVADASDIPRAAKALDERLWAMGYGYGLISKSGSILKRNLIDMAVYQASRLDFVGGAALEGGMTQERPEPKLWRGDL